MFERFTERARQTMVCAQDEARALKHGHIDTEHVLLGLLRVEDGLAARVLESLDITVEEVRAQVARINGQGDKKVTTGQIPFTPRAKKILELALREALSLGHNYVGPEHILLGLVSENEGVAARILLDFDADAETIRREVESFLEEKPRVPPPPAPSAEEIEELLREHRRVRSEQRRAAKEGDHERVASLRARKRQIVRRLGRHRGLAYLPRWEYRAEDRTDDVDRLNELGAEGWELVAIVRGQALLKRSRRGGRKVRISVSHSPRDP